jgi:hypothetical protein
MASRQCIEDQRSTAPMKSFREPLVHFLLLGAALFGIFAWAGKQSADKPERIVVTPGLLENLKLSFTRQAGHPPSDKDMEEAIEAYVREEVLTREAQRLGLDRDDPIVRRRLVQRIEFLTEDSVLPRTPTDEELRMFLQENAARFKTPDGRLPDLAEARPAVQRAWLEARRKEALDGAYRKLRERYAVVREKPAAGAKP